MKVKCPTKRRSEFVGKHSPAKIHRHLPPPPPRFRSYLRTTTVYLLEPPNASTTPPCVIAIVKSNSNSTLHLYHPLTDKPHLHVSHLPDNFNLSRFDPINLSVSIYSTSLYNKLVPFPVPELTNSNYDDCSLLGLFNGGHVRACPPSNMGHNWRKLSTCHKFDDIALFNGNVYVLDRLGKVYEVNIGSFYGITLGKTLVNTPGSVDCEWRKRLVVDGDVLYLVARTGRRSFKVFMRDGCDWVGVKGYGGNQVLFIGRDCYFFMVATEEYKDCLVFSEGAFPRYGKCGWLYENEDDICVFRLRDGIFERERDYGLFPRINWSPPDWIFSERVEDEEIHPINISDSDSQDQDDGKMQCDSDSQEKENEEMHTNARLDVGPSLKKDVSPSLFEHEPETIHTLSASLSVAEEVARSLLSMNAGNDAPKQAGISRTNITQSVPRACTLSKTTSYKNDSGTTKFEGMDIRSDFVPTLQKIWRKYGNIIENSTIRSGDIVARALESLATVIKILEDNSAQSLSDSEADYLSSTLADLRCICFKVYWLVPFVEKAVQLHKCKHLLESFNSLSELSSKVQKRRTMLSDELAKLDEEENKLKEEMAKVSKMIPFSGKFKLGEPLGLGLI